MWQKEGPKNIKILQGVNSMSTVTRVEHIGDATLYLGDCLEILEYVNDVDVLITDPPYGVNFKGKNYTVTNAGGYDTSDNDEIGALVVNKYLYKFKRSLIFSGTRQLFRYPEPYDIGSVFCPAGAGRGRWGFTLMNPVLFYGKATQYGLHTPNSLVSYAIAEKNGHPVPKPLEWMIWAVRKASNIGETIVDPFMGSGTTGAACAELGRKFIGIEISEKYFDIACKRIERAYSQLNLFDKKEIDAIQKELEI